MFLGFLATFSAETYFILFRERKKGPNLLTKSDISKEVRNPENLIAKKN